MKSLMFTAEILKVKLEALDKYGRAVTHRTQGLKEINQNPDGWEGSIIDGEWTKTFSGAFQFIRKPLLAGENNLRAVKPKYSPCEVVYLPEAFQTFQKDTEEEATLRFKAGQNIKSVDDLIKWAELPYGHGDIGILYAADFGKWAYDPDSDLRPWLSPYWMKADYARHFARIVSVRPERIQEIKPEDCKLEGINPKPYEEWKVNQINVFWLNRFAMLWDSLSKPPFDWAGNPWTWRIEFEREKRG